MDRLTIDPTQARAICDEVGERLRGMLKSPANDNAPEFDDKIDQLSDELAERNNPTSKIT